MQKIRKFLVTTEASPEGIEYTYDTTTGLFVGVEIKQANMIEESRKFVVSSLAMNLESFIKWANTMKCECVELQMGITYEEFWKKYDDKLRSSKKRSEKIWNKLSEADQVKAYYFINTYNRNRGNAEKKYCETYLNAELWNN